MPSVSTAHCTRSTGGECHRQTEVEIQLIGRRKVSVTSHPSCNFHMRNGITPVMPLRAAGVNVAMGLDDKTINDDEDAVMELQTSALEAFTIADPDRVWTVRELRSTPLSAVAGRWWSARPKRSRMN
jgi:hypothetical protein